MFGGIEGVEVVEFGFDIRTICDGEAELGEDAGHLVDDSGDGVDGAASVPVPGEGEIKCFGRRGRGFKRRLPAIQGFGDGIPEGVEGLSKGGFFGGGHVPQIFHQSGKRSVPSDVFDTKIFDFGRIFGG